MYYKTPTYFFNEIKEADVTLRENWGECDYKATLCEYFGDFFIVLIAYSQSRKINCKAHSWHDAEQEFDKFIALHSMSKVAA